MQIKKISLNDYKAKNQNANDFRKRGAIDLFKSQIQNAVFRFKHNKGKKTKIMDFNFLFGQIQLILFDISTMFGYDCLFLSLYDSLLSF